MALGLHGGHTSAQDNATKDALDARVQALVACFEARHGSTACRQLTETNMLDAAERQGASDRGVFTTLCPQLVRTAPALVAEEMERAAALVAEELNSSARRPRESGGPGGAQRSPGFPHSRE